MKIPLDRYIKTFPNSTLKQEKYHELQKGQCWAPVFVDYKGKESIEN